MDPTIRKSRDDALAALRNCKVEIAQLKEEIVILRDKLRVAEQVVADLDNQKALILEAQKNIQENMVNMLNAQEAKFKEEITAKNNRIKELENMVMEQMKISHG